MRRNVGLSYQHLDCSSHHIDFSWSLDSIFEKLGKNAACGQIFCDPPAFKTLLMPYWTQEVNSRTLPCYKTLHKLSTFWRQMTFWLPEKTMKLCYTLMFYVLYTLSDLIHMQRTNFVLKVLSLILELESSKKVAKIESLRQNVEVSNIQSGPP